MMEPVIDAFTRSKYPARSAMMAMMSSAALPKVAFSRPPSPAPICSARASVAWPIIPASGITARHERTKIRTGCACSAYSATKATGTNTSRVFSQLPPNRRLITLVFLWVQGGGPPDVWQGSADYPAARSAATSPVFATAPPPRGSLGKPGNQKSRA
jgi:hypothetical protein